MAKKKSHSDDKAQDNDGDEGVNEAAEAAAEKGTVAPVRPEERDSLAEERRLEKRRQEAEAREAEEAKPKPKTAKQKREAEAAAAPPDLSGVRKEGRKGGDLPEPDDDPNVRLAEPLARIEQLKADGDIKGLETYSRRQADLANARRAPVLKLRGESDEEWRERDNKAGRAHRRDQEDLRRLAQEAAAAARQVKNERLSR